MLSEVTHVVSDSSVDAYAFTFDWLRAAHIHVSINGTELDPDDDFTISGDSGAATCTITGTPFTNLAVLDEIRIWKETPQTFDLRTVDFETTGVVSETTMDDAIKHCISLTQDINDELDTALKYDSDDKFQAGARIIADVLPGQDANDVATVGQITSIVADAGNLPGATDYEDGCVLVVDSGSWEVKTPSGFKTTLGFGSLADLDSGTASTEVQTNAENQSTFLQIINNLSDLEIPADARDNLGLGTAAVEDTGTLAGNVVALDINARLPAVDGRNLNMSSHSLSGRGGGLLDVCGWFQFTAAQALDQESATPGAMGSGFLTNSARNLDVDGTEGLNAFRNTSTDIAISTTNDTFTLKAGQWIVDIDLKFYVTQSAATYAANYGWGLVKHSDGSVQEGVAHYGSTIGINDRGTATYSPETSTWHRRIILDLASNTELAVRAAYNGTHAVNLMYGQVFVQKLED